MIEKNDTEFIQEAQYDILRGFSKIYEVTNIDFLTFKNLLDVYRNKIAEFDNEVAKRVIEIENVIIHKYHSQWLTKFNSKFIGSYERTNKRTVRVA